MSKKIRYKQLGTRSRKSVFNIILSFGAKGLSILISLAVVPLTIHYVNPTRYGIWLTLSSIIAWIGFFNLGLGMGMRNKFAEAKAKNDFALAKQYVSTTYFTLGLIVLGLFLIAVVGNLYLKWDIILNVDRCYREELSKVFVILAGFFCLNIVTSLFTTLLTADQRPGVGSVLEVTGQLLSLLAIYLLTNYSEGSLLNLALFYAGIPTITILVWSIIAFRFTRYRQYTPSLRSYKPKLIKDILSLGIKFFVIYLCMIAIFQIINVAISREIGAEAVTRYNIANKYFNIIYSVAMIILSPFWTAFTDAYNQNDFRWMRRVKTVLERLWLCAIVAVVGMMFFAGIFYHYWIGDNVSIETSLTIGMGIFVLVQTLGALYMNLINGIGKVRFQLIIYIIFALMSYPMMIFSCRYFGLIGVIISPALCYFVQAIFAKIQLEKLLRGESNGIWAK